MGALRKAGVWLGIVEDDEDGRYDDGGYAESGYARRYPEQRDRHVGREEVDPEADYAGQGDDDEALAAEATDAPRLRAAAAASQTRANLRTVARSHPAPAATPIHEGRTAYGSRPVAVLDDDDPSYRITTLHPTSYNEARTIGEHFRDGTPVIMNLTEMDESDAKRLVDFAAGLAFGLRGTIERVTNRVFLLSPANVTVTAEDKARIAEGGFLNQN